MVGNILIVRFTGITFVMFRRFRELAWIGVGLLCLSFIVGDR